MVSAVSVVRTRDRSLRFNIDSRDDSILMLIK